MGHYCYKCGEKLAAGISPTKCNCIECFCAKCWDELFGGYVLIKEGIHKGYYELDERDTVKCMECDVLWYIDDYEYY